MGWIQILIAAVLVAAAPSHAASMNPPGQALERQVIELGTGSAAYRFALYGNHAMNGDMSGIRRIIIIQHGLRRDGDAYYAAAAKMMEEHDIDARTTLLVAPQFYAAFDTGKVDLSGMPVWSKGGWLGGMDSVAGPLTISSLQVYDDLLAWLSDRDRFPALARIVVAGHSAGGQLVQRYAVLGHIDGKIRAAGIRMRYVIANPSSYLYFTNERPQGDHFAPFDGAACLKFNEYKYGFENLVHYAAGDTAAAAFKRYAARDVVYLLGAGDTDPNHRVLDKSCPGEAQGRYRLERGLAYVRYERHLADSRIKLAHHAYEVVGVGHDQKRMFSSVCGARLVFGVPDARAAGGAQCVEIAPNRS